MLGKSRSIVFSQWFVGRVGRKVGSLKRRVRSHLVRWEIKNCTPLCGEGRFEADVEKWHTAVTKHISKSTNTPAPNHFWKFWCGNMEYTKHTMLGPVLGCGCPKIAGRCGAKQISKSKSSKNWHSRTTFGRADVEKWHAAVARSTFPSQNAQTTTVLERFWRFGW